MSMIGDQRIYRALHWIVAPTNNRCLTLAQTKEDPSTLA
jgi:hypothetical protein